MKTKMSTTNARPRIKLVGVGGFGRKILNSIGPQRQVERFSVDTNFVPKDGDTEITQIPIEIDEVVYCDDAYSMVFLPPSVVERMTSLYGETSFDCHVSGIDSDTGPLTVAALIPEHSEACWTSLFDKTDFLVLVSGMGGVTGTVATAAIARLAKAHGIPVAAFVTEPFDFEGKFPRQFAQKGIAAMSQIPALFVLSNECLSQLAEEPLTPEKAKRVALNLISNSVIDLISLVNGDADNVSGGTAIFDHFSKVGVSLVGSALASGDFKIDLAMSEALGQLPLEHPGLRQAEEFLVVLSAGSDFLISEMVNAARWIENIALPEAHIILSTKVDPVLKEDVRVTVMAMGVPKLS